MSQLTLPDIGAAFAPDDAPATSAIPIHAVSGDDALAALDLTPAQRQWIEANGFAGKAKSRVLVPGDDGAIAAILFGLGAKEAGEPCGPADLLLGDLVKHLPHGNYRLASGWTDRQLAGIAWGLGAYRFSAHKTGSKTERARLVLNDAADRRRVRQIVRSVWLGREMINTPSNAMGPDELEGAARLVADAHGAVCDVTAGDALLEQNFPLIHAVGRASARAPRLIDVTWGRADAPRVTVIGKGVCFDTGGLDLKPASAMLLMKKDMGGAAAALSLADMIMGLEVDVRLRLLIPAVENSVAGNAFRPGDIIKSRAGHTVEIGNTDAEGRLVLADALALGDEDEPGLMMTFATLTGAARVALGPDLPPCFVDDDDLAAAILSAGLAVGDPVWRMPFWAGYNAMLDSPNADFNNVSDGPFAGAVTAALFLKRFVKQARHYAHFDIYGWRQAARPLGPKGGEPHVARTMLDVITKFAAKGPGA